MSEHQPDFGDAESSDAEKEHVFQQYMKNLSLTEEDFSKKILDVGSGGGEFASWVQERGFGANIVSLDPQAVVKKSPQGVSGVAEAMPFAERSFDLVLAHATIPNLYYTEEPETVETKVRESFNEMLRIVRNGGEVRIGPVWRKFAEYPAMRRLREAVDVVLGELKTAGIGVELKNEKHWIDTTPDGEQQEKESALIILKKPLPT